MEEVTGFQPFPWQRRLLRDVLESGWPSLLDLPTGVGKTSALLVAVFALALEPDRFQRRMALVVDRRMIVDQIDGFARRLLDALRDDRLPTCRAVARSLVRAGGEPTMPVRVVHLRGGIPRDDTWLGTPDQPTIISSTVDQVGSRLLFRGYGVSESMRPVHAGVLARDTLYFLDEVHLATAFEQTLRTLEDVYESWAEVEGTGRPLKVVRMSATPGPGVPLDTVFELDDSDHDHPVLSRRLAAQRDALLEVVKTKRAATPEGRRENRRIFAREAAVRARDAAKQGARSVGVVVNRVDTARRVAANLEVDADAEVLLITGRMRPFDRIAIQRRLSETVVAGSKVDANRAPVFVVATSCIEAGADLDFDALVTEVASLDALRQRFGRLNRLGARSQVWAWILAAKDQVGDSAPPDPVYGEALRETWSYLIETAKSDGGSPVVDMSLTGFVVPADDRIASLLPPLSEAPVLFPSYLDMWSETRPAPHPDPTPALWLHGKGSEELRDVQLIFRADVPQPVDEPNAAQFAGELLEFLPPRSDEAVAIPLHEFRHWLGEGAEVWTWNADGVELVAIQALKPGATVIMPAMAGGLVRGTWNPEGKTPVDDVAELAAATYSEVVRLRLDPRVLPAELAATCPSPSSSDDPDASVEAEAACNSWLDSLPSKAAALDQAWRKLVARLVDPNARRSLRVLRRLDDQPIWLVVVSPAGRALEATTEDAVSVYAGLKTTLADHLADVEAWASHYAKCAALSEGVAEDVALAGLLHDVGKADARFQALLRGGDPIAAAGDELLAKSTLALSAAARARAERRSGWPSGFRHELVSLALFDAAPELVGRANDPELVRHLIASHHGWCRPWAPSVVDAEPVGVNARIAGVSMETSTGAIDDGFLSDCASRFRRLCRRYGWHQLAYLEALVRLGDHRASARPGSRPEDHG